MTPAEDGRSPAPIDRPILGFLRDRLQATRQFTLVEITSRDGHLELRGTVGREYYPDPVQTAVLSVRWYTNDDFTIHYREDHADTGWQCRWDCHPNPHNTRDHYHPPPDAPTPGEDADWPTDYRDVLGLVLDDIESRIQSLWNR